MTFEEFDMNCSFKEVCFFSNFLCVFLSVLFEMFNLTDGLFNEFYLHVQVVSLYLGFFV